MFQCSVNGCLQKLSKSYNFRQNSLRNHAACSYHHHRTHILPIHDKQFKACLLFSVNHLHIKFKTFITWLQSTLKASTIRFYTGREMAHLLTLRPHQKSSYLLNLLTPVVCSKHNTEVSSNGFTNGKFTFQECNPRIMTFWNDASIMSSVMVVHTPGGKYD